MAGFAAQLRHVQLEAGGQHALMMAVRKHQDIVQWSYQRVPLNVVPRIPLLGYLDIDQLARLPDEGTIRTFPWGRDELHNARTRASANGCTAQHGDRKAHPGTGQQ